MREAPGGKVQMYGVSVLLHDDLVAQSGKDKAHGMVLSQSLPYYTMYKPVITEYQQVMKRYAPKSPSTTPAWRALRAPRLPPRPCAARGTPSRERIPGSIAAVRHL